MPGTSDLFKEGVRFLRKSSAPDSEAARDKGLVQKKTFFGEKVLPQAAKLPGTRGLFKKIYFFEKKVLPQAAKLPGTSGLSKKKSHFLRKSSAPGSEAARDKWLLQKKKSHF